MDQQKDQLLRSAVSVFKELGLTELTLKDGDFQLELKKQSAPVTVAASALQAVSPTSITTAAPTETPVSSGASAITECGNVIKAPLIGIFYAAPSPDAPPFVKVGDRVKKGDILCIIEAMKMMNEITADADGTISEIIAKNGKMVEFGQTLFKLTD